MITQADLTQAIAECWDDPRPNANTCIKLAAFLTIQREMFGEEKEDEQSFSPAPSGTIVVESNSEFAQIVSGMEQERVMPVIDELMDTLKMVFPKLYNAVLNKLT